MFGENFVLKMDGWEKVCLSCGNKMEPWAEADDGTEVYICKECDNTWIKPCEKIEDGKVELRKNLKDICKNLDLFTEEPVGIEGEVEVDGETYTYHFEVFK